MGLRTNPDRILENIDRQRIREEEAQAGQDRQAVGRELETEIPDVDATTPERMRRIFEIVERSYTKAASNVELGKLASHFRTVGDIPTHHARGDISVSIQYIDSARLDDIGMSPFEILPEQTLRSKEGNENEPSRRKCAEGAPPRDPGWRAGGVQEGPTESSGRAPGPRRHGPCRSAGDHGRAARGGAPTRRRVDPLRLADDRVGNWGRARRTTPPTQGRAAADHGSEPSPHSFGRT